MISAVPLLRSSAERRRGRFSYPLASTADKTFSRVSGETQSSPFSTRDIVAVETPISLDISSKVLPI
jgi:hypothetical protein